MRSQTAILYRSTHMQSHAHDELLKIYRREYKRRFAWSKEAQKEKERCENGEISQKEFVRWLKQ